jgi:hypothetical protein
MPKDRRPGAVVAWLPFAMLGLLAAFAFAVNNGRLATIRIEMQGTADAAALAAAETLVGDDLLRGDPKALPQLLLTSSSQATLFAGLNLVKGKPFALQPNPTNLADGDIIFGTLDRPRGTPFVLAANVQDPTNTALAEINTVQVKARLTRQRGNAPNMVFAPFIGLSSANVRTVAAAMLDRDVIGFRPLGQQPLKLAPFALFSDPTGSDPKSWQNLIEEKNGPDAYRYDAALQTFVQDSQGDGLREFAAVMALDASQAASANVSLLFIGFDDASGAGQQLTAGITPDRLASLGGQLVLDRQDNHLTMTGRGVGPAANSTALTAIQQGLQQLRQTAQPRIWPLYCGFSDSNQPVLCGFVAARVVTVAGVDPNEPVFRFTLQPTMISTATAVTDANQRGVGGVTVVNPYICKVRLVE